MDDFGVSIALQFVCKQDVLTENIKVFVLRVDYGRYTDVVKNNKYIGKVGDGGIDFEGVLDVNGIASIIFVVHYTF